MKDHSRKRRLVLATIRCATFRRDEVICVSDINDMANFRRIHLLPAIEIAVPGSIKYGLSFQGKLQASGPYLGAMLQLNLVRTLQTLMFLTSHFLHTDGLNMRRTRTRANRLLVLPALPAGSVVDFD